MTVGHRGGPKRADVPDELVLELRDEYGDEGPPVVGGAAVARRDWAYLIPAAQLSGGDPLSHRSDWRRLVKRSDLPVRVQHVILHLSECRWSDGVYSRSHIDLADDLKMGTATIERCLRLALKSGWLEIEDRGQKYQQQTYRLSVPESQHAT